MDKHIIDYYTYEIKNNLIFKNKVLQIKSSKYEEIIKKFLNSEEVEKLHNEIDMCENKCFAEMLNEMIQKQLRINDINKKMVEIRKRRRDS